MYFICFQILGNAHLVQLEFFSQDNSNTGQLSEEIVVDENGIISIPGEFLDSTSGAALVDHLIIHLLEPTEEDMEEFHVNIDIIGCAKNIRCKCISSLVSEISLYELLL